ncbi:lectin-like domain-containing protein [Pontibacter harenae]|uniref:lectin-like domain-containing protein n=1 Tax=Pontibacter harenae TaxID=2894083 RepID=UPI001E4C85B4|nr:gliding motility-associated C-terminal domain-containing protein [Pontibacter harenae]MCC9166218.1 gliding motility-associated C-terminal domain-containing protein [Pontibacter harenae]
MMALYKMFGKNPASWLCNKIAVLVTVFFLLTPGALKAQFETRGDATRVTDNCYRITEDKQNQHGAIWGTEKIDFSEPFRLDFVIFLGSKNNENNGADGLALVFHDDPRGRDAIGSTGAGLGFGPLFYSKSSQAIKPSVAVELDTRNHGGRVNDLEEDHTALVYNGEIRRQVAGPVAIDPAKPNVQDNQCHDYTITWDPITQELMMLYDNVVRLRHKDDIINNVFKGVTQVYYGFTGSTSESYNEQTVCVLDNDNNMPVAVNDKAETQQHDAVSIFVLGNDSHTAGAKIFLTGVVEQPSNGTVVVSGNEVVYTPREWFSGKDTFTYQISESTSNSCYAKPTTAQVEVTVICKIVQQEVPIKVEGKNVICEGDNVMLRVPYMDESTYQWKLNGVPVGDNLSEYVATSSGIYTVEISSACGTARSTNVAVEVVSAPAAPVAEDVGRCGPGSTMLTATGGHDGAYRWYESQKSTVPLTGATGSTFTTPDLQETKTYYVSIVSAAGCETSRVPVKALVYDLPAANAGEDMSITLGGQANLSGSGGTSYRWEPEASLDNPNIANPIARPEETTVYTVTVTNEAGCEFSDEMTVYVEKELGIPNAISPNGDNVNDNWVIKNIDTHPNARLEIYDRWGSRLYEAVGYKNDWNGYYQGKVLPASTYYYLITLRGERKLTGSISIVY